MKHIKKIFIIIFFFSLFGLIHTQDLSQQTLEEQIEADLFDYNPDMSRIGNDAANITLTRAPKSMTVTTLSTIKAHEVLQAPIYLRSNPIARRNVIDLPIFQSFATFIPLEKFSMQPFFTQTYKEFYFKEHEGIGRYIELDQDYLIRKMNAEIDAINEVLQTEAAEIGETIPKIQVPSLLTTAEVLLLFKDIKSQERRLGFMFDYTKSTPTWAFSIRTPLHYVEHNFFLNKTEQKSIAQHPLFKDMQGDIIPFALQHLVSDYLGLGDTKVTFESLIKETDTYSLSVGAKTTLPTMFRLGKGIIGSYFDVNKPDFEFDLHADALGIPADPTLAVITDAEKEKIRDNIERLGLAALDRLSTMVLEQGAQNNHHIGLGLFTHSTMHFNEHAYLSTLSSGEVFLPGPEKRFFVIKNDPATFARFNWINDGAENDAKIAFLNTQLKRRLFPPAYETRVFPGFVFQSTAALTLELKKWNVIIGTDFWWHTKEHFLHINAPSETKDLLQIETARRDHIYQTGTWIAFERHPSENSDWQFGIRIGSTGLSNGIGRDISGSLHLENFF